MELAGLVQHVSDDRLMDLHFEEPPIPFPMTHAGLGEALAKLPKKMAFTGSVFAVCARLQQELNISTRAMPLEKPSLINTFSPVGTWQIDITNWTYLETIDVGDELAPEIVANERTYCFKIGRDQNRIHLTIITGPAPETWRRQLTDRIIDKRDMQKRLKLFAKRDLAIQRVRRLVGIHLLYLDHFPDIPQFGCTYWDYRWRRRFSIVLDDTEGQPHEFAFLATFEGDFYNCCRNSFALEWLTRSLHWTAPAEGAT